MTRNPSIDGLRGIAALLVIVFHSFGGWMGAWPDLLLPGQIGVRLFFVLSGCLITNLLWSLKDQGGSFGQTWLTFAWRRALRIFPLAYLTLALCWLAGVPAMHEKPWWLLTFTTNIGMAVSDTWPDQLGLYWTLAIEEQFYLTWPLLVLLIDERHWPRVAWTLIGVAALSRWLAWTLEIPGYHWTPFYLDGFAAGSLIAWAARAGVKTTLMGWLGVALVAVSGPFDSNLHWTMQETGAVLVSAALVNYAWTRPASLLALRPIAWVGSISYGVYLWHAVGPTLLYQVGVPRFTNPWLTFALQAGLGIGLAALTWYGFERPINRLKDKKARAGLDTGFSRSLA